MITTLRQALEGILKSAILVFECFAEASGLELHVLE